VDIIVLNGSQLCPSIWGQLTDVSDDFRTGNSCPQIWGHTDGVRVFDFSSALRRFSIFLRATLRNDHRTRPPRPPSSPRTTRPRPRPTAHPSRTRHQPTHATPLPHPRHNPPPTDEFWSISVSLDFETESTNLDTRISTNDASTLIDVGHGSPRRLGRF